VQRLERQGSNREINATSVHYDYYVGGGQTKTIRRYWSTTYSAGIGKLISFKKRNYAKIKRTEK
jgi:hypothetical protein